jgi:hypothetical protein
MPALTVPESPSELQETSTSHERIEEESVSMQCDGPQKLHSKGFVLFRLQRGLQIRKELGQVT